MEEVGTLACLRGCKEGCEAQRFVGGAFAGCVFPNRILPDVAPQAIDASLSLAWAVGVCEPGCTGLQGSTEVLEPRCHTLVGLLNGLTVAGEHDQVIRISEDGRPPPLAVF